MKLELENISLIRQCAVVIAVLFATVGCQRDTESSIFRSGSADPLSVVLLAHEGPTRTDEHIRHFQERVRAGHNREAALEQLGWSFVAKARESFDAGFYKLAGQCALALQTHQPRSPEALLLRGHVLHSLHEFKAAEPLARELVAQRGLSFDYGLLGDVLMEQGRLDEAVEVYQTMMDLRPDLHAYARAAHMRWLKGDVAGAIELMRLAVGAASPRDSESAAWANTRLAGYLFQSGARPEAEQACDFALGFQNAYAPALLLRGRMLLASGKVSEAIPLLDQAAKLNPLPEYQWVLAETLREADRTEEARAVESELRRHGPVSDPRTFALFLATRGESSETALQLATRELDSRADVFTHDALAWSLATAGRAGEAHAEMNRALAEGTEDARLFFHAAMIATRSGRAGEAKRWIEKTSHLMHLLLPSERKQLQTAAAQMRIDMSIASIGADTGK